MSDPDLSSSSGHAYFGEVTRSDGCILGALGLHDRFGEAGLAQRKGLVGFALLGRFGFARVLLGGRRHSLFAPAQHEAVSHGLVPRLLESYGTRQRSQQRS